MTTMHRHVVATVDDAELPLAEVEARLAELRAGRLAAVLPAADTAEGRNMRRWVVQLCAAERIVRHECAARGLEVSQGKESRLAVESALQVGGVASAVLHRIPAALQLVPPVSVPETEVRSYYDRNSDLFTVPFEQARVGIEAELGEHRRVAAFGHWLDRAMRDRVHLEVGFEHPAEPGHPDSTHRH